MKCPDCVHLKERLKQTEKELKVTEKYFYIVNRKLNVTYEELKRMRRAEARAIKNSLKDEGKTK